MRNNNNLPPFAEQIFTPTESVIGEQIEQQNIQEILDEFKQIVPSNFIKLEINYMCSTTDWKEPVCERYGFSINSEWKQIDITQDLIKKLGLEKGNINYPFYLHNEVLNKIPSYGAITIESEEEIFLDRPLTLTSLESELTRWVNEIITLKTKISELENGSENQQILITNLQNEKDGLINRISELEQSLNQSETNSESEITKLKDWIRQIKMELVPLFWPNAIYTEDTPTAEILIAKIKQLIREKENIVNESNNQAEELSQKEAEINNHLQRIEELENNIVNLEQERNRLNQRPTEEQLQEKQRQINELNNRITNLSTDLGNERNRINNLQQQISQKISEIGRKDNLITNLRNEKQQLETERDTRPNITLQEYDDLREELERERTWLTRWNQNSSPIDWNYSKYSDSKKGYVRLRFSPEGESPQTENLIQIEAKTEKGETYYSRHDYMMGGWDHDEFKELDWHNNISLDKFKELLEKIRDYYLNN